MLESEAEIHLSCVRAGVGGRSFQGAGEGLVYRGRNKSMLLELLSRMRLGRAQRPPEHTDSWDEGWWWVGWEELCESRSTAEFQRQIAGKTPRCRHGSCASTANGADGPLLANTWTRESQARKIAVPNSTD